VDTAPLITFLVSALEHVCNRLGDSAVPRGRTAISFADDSWTVGVRDEPRWDIVVWKAFTDDQLWRLPEASPAASTIWNAGAFHGWGVVVQSDMSLEEFTPWAVHALMPVLIAYLGTKDAATYFPTELQETVDQYVASWHDPERLDEVVVPLFGLEIAEEMSLDPWTTITPLSDAGKGKLWSQWEADLGITRIQAFGRTKCCIRARAASPRPRMNSSPAEVISRCARLISAFRLLKDGDIFAGGVFVKALPPVIDRISAVYALLEFRHGGIRIGAHYDFLAKDVSGVRHLYERLGGAHGKTPDDLDLPVRRFNLAHSRDHLDDEVIDLAVALESCLLNGSNAELSYRFVLRGAALLGHPPEGVSYGPLLKAFYDVRSAIVHGGKSLAQMANTSKTMKLPEMAFLSEVRGITRRILVAYLNRVHPGKSLAEINGALEQHILSSVSFKPAEPRERVV
jgi:hypothetical protein